MMTFMQATFMVFIFMLGNNEDKINVCSIVNAVLDVSKVLTFFVLGRKKTIMVV